MATYDFPIAATFPEGIDPLGVLRSISELAWTQIFSNKMLVSGDTLTLHFAGALAVYEAATNLPGVLQCSFSPSPSLAYRNAVIRTRNTMIAEDIPNWGSMTDAQKKLLIQLYVWPNGTPVAELDAIVPATERQARRDEVIQSTVCPGCHLLLDEAENEWYLLSVVGGALTSEHINTYETLLD